MGNTSSSTQSNVEGMYKSYIDKQFNTIQEQQNQITQLINNIQSNNNQSNGQISIENFKKLNKLQQLKYIENLKKKKLAQQIHKTEQTKNKTEQINKTEQSKNNAILKLENKLNPYKILNINQKYDKSSLKKAYLKAAYNYHPDRGGTEDEFQKVSIAYTVLMKKLEQKIHNNHNDLKQHFKTNVNNSYTKLEKKFDINVFNQIYQENKLEGVYDRGYGDWFTQQNTGETQPKMFNKKFNKDMFNHEFEKYKSSKKNTNQIVLRNPIENISYNGSDSIVELGKKKVENFSGNSGNLGYRDLKDAYENSTLINQSSVDYSNRINDVRQLKSTRSQINYKMSNSDLQSLQKEQLKQKLQEKNRLARLIESDKQISNNYQKIHNRLTG